MHTTTKGWIGRLAAGLAALPRRGLLAASSAVVLGLASTSAQAQSWNVYQPYTNSTFVPFVSSLSASQGALVNLTVGPSGNVSSRQPVTMDTGSIGIQVSADNWNPGSLTPIGAGSINLNSSGVTNSGNFYSVPVNFFNGSTNVATATVPVLVVTRSVTCPPGGGSCTTNNNPTGIFYMGVGLNRTAGESLVTPNAQLVNGQTLNPFLNVTQIPGQTVSTNTIRQGYIINTANGATGGVTLGLTQQNTQGMSFVKLAPTTSGSLDTWNTAPMSVTVTNGGQSTTASSGSNPPSGTGVLPDAGINYMFLSPTPSNVVTQTCTLSGGTRNCLPAGTQVQVSLPGSGAASGLAQYSFTVGGSNVVQPVAVATLSGGAFVNTGREFFLGFQYLYDSVGGYVGYAALPALAGAGSVNLGVALSGQVGLANGFANSLPVFLIGDTTLQQTGTGTFSSSITGSGFNLAVSGGSLLFGAPVDLAGGTFFVQSGASATIGSSFAASALSVSSGGRFVIGSGGSLAGAPSVTNFGLFDISGASQPVMIQALKGTGQVNLGGQNLTISNASGTFSGTIADGGVSGGAGGSLTLAGGTLELAGASTYTGGTTVASGATLNLTGSIIGSLSVSGAMTSTGGYAVAPGATFSNSGSFQSLGGATLVNQGTLTNSGLITSNILNGSVLSNTGTIIGDVTNTGTLTNNGVIQGVLANSGTLNGNGTFAGNFTNNGVLNSNGTFTGNVTNLGTLAGNPTIVGNLTNLGTLAPGNSIGTVTVVGNAVLGSGTSYNVEVNNAGQSDRLAVSGSVAIQGGTVAVSPASGVYAPRTTYTIVSSTGLTGGFGSVSSSGSPFLQPSLSYDANNAYLSLTIGGFLAAAQNPVQAAVGGAIDGSVLQASGDYAQVLGNLANSNPAQVPAILTSLSGMNYSGLSSSMVQGAQLFMNNFAGQTGGTAAAGSRVALAEACDVACDPNALPQWGAWGGGIGGFGTIGAQQPVGGVTYNAGGFAAGIDRLITPATRLGVTAGYTAGTQWVSGFAGQSKSDTFNVGLYGNYAQDKVYADALVGYAYSGNQMWRPISIPGLQPRTALGQTGANQFYGQIETGYRFDLGGTAQAFVTPFARLQAYTGTQNAFTETGAQSLNLTVAQQTTNSLRSVLGAQLGGAMDLGWREKLAMQFRLGWSHEYADVGRPVTATLAGAPAMPFTTFGVSPQRDGIVLGLSATTAIADATSIYLRYEGNIAGQDSAQAITAGVRMTW